MFETCVRGLHCQDGFGSRSNASQRRSFYKSPTNHALRSNAPHPEESSGCRSSWRSAWLSFMAVYMPGQYLAKAPPRVWHTSCAVILPFCKQVRLLRKGRSLHHVTERSCQARNANNHLFLFGTRAGAPEHPRAGIGESRRVAGAPQRRNEGHPDVPPAGMPPWPDRLRAIPEPGTFRFGMDTRVSFERHEDACSTSSAV